MLPRISVKKPINMNIEQPDTDEDLKSLIEKTNKLSDSKKIELSNLICYLNVALYSNSFDTNNKLGNFKIIKEGVIKAIQSIFGNISDNDINIILKMCTHEKTGYDSVDSLTKAATQFLKKPV